MKKYKYTEIGTYVKPDTSRLPEGMDASQAKAYLKVYTGKQGTPITLQNGDLLTFTTKAQKLKDLEAAVANGKMSEEVFERLAKVYGDERVIAAVTLKQPV
jgi:hypothetical protein